MLTYACEVTDPHPIFGGKVVRRLFPTRKEATWYGEREVAAAAAECGMQGVTFRVLTERTDRKQG